MTVQLYRRLTLDEWKMLRDVFVVGVGSADRAIAKLKNVDSLRVSVSVSLSPKHNEVTTATNERKETDLKCSFCDKGRKQVAGLVARDHCDQHVAICNECVSLCLNELSKLAHTKKTYRRELARGVVEAINGTDFVSEKSLLAMRLADVFPGINFKIGSKGIEICDGPSIKIDPLPSADPRFRETLSDD